MCVVVIVSVLYTIILFVFCFCLCQFDIQKCVNDVAGPRKARAVT